MNVEFVDVFAVVESDCSYVVCMKLSSKTAKCHCGKNIDD